MSAANFGDVWKHNVLLEVVNLIRKENFNYVETHGNYDNHTVTHNGSAPLGYYYLSKKYNYSLPSTLYTQINNPPTSAARYSYLSSWMQVYDLLKKSQIKSFKETIFEINQSVCTAVAPHISNHTEICYTHGNGFTGVLNLTNSPDLVFIDPFYTKAPVTEMKRVKELASKLDQKSVPYLIWYPIYRSQIRSKRIKTHLLDQFPHGARRPHRLELHDISNNKNSSHIPITGMIFSDTLSHYIQTVKTNLNYLDSSKNPCLNWSIV
ncbi:hypothetical protein [Paenibacillus sp. FSL W7-1287]|uniref:hypothetical protein n=1 Tax=Paenibacillus sp. FSL W7-1287 TaxID=2954538 RepID=UPI0030F921CC